MLSRFRDEERPLVAEVVRAAADGLELLLAEGSAAAMAHVNGLELAGPATQDEG